MRIPGKSSTIFWNAIGHFGLILERLGLDYDLRLAESVLVPIWGWR
jgi:hypothetical protein